MRRLKSLFIVAALCLGGFAFLLHAQEQFPTGTVIAVVLDQTVDSRVCQPGQIVIAEIAQEVPLGNKRVIRAHSKVLGEVTRVQNGAGAAQLGLRFDRIEFDRKQAAISAQARAVASPIEVTGTSQPKNGPGPRSDWTTVQVGNDVVYGNGGKIENEMGKVVGKAVPGGVLVTVSNRPGSQCEGMPLSKTPQPIWVFSANACGVYGFRRFQFENGTDEKPGEILFTQKNRHEDRSTTVKLPAGTAFLLAISGASH
jgi:hypothetical protein